MDRPCDNDWSSSVDDKIMASALRKKERWQSYLLWWPLDVVFEVTELFEQSVLNLLSFCPFPLCPLPSPCRRTRQHWQCVRPSVEMFCTDFCPMCLCPVSRYGLYYLHANCVWILRRTSPVSMIHWGLSLYSSSPLSNIISNILIEPSGVAAQVWEGSSWKLSCTIHPCIRGL